ncbi:MAG: prepilin-type N-terminal cleavage/methylation domain-containing protein [Candidatus Gastranaerophilales bacterium]|nr:prepilin-type N-terminal cleavage/methylation domain-containing protein [Candidatus Gastranaerophilales bacterium]
MKKKLGFTLAETLIVIAIIGIIASIVTPMLFGTTNDAELKAAWKKSYSDLAQVTQLIAIDNGGTLAGAFQNSEDIGNAYSSKLNFIKKCSAIASYGGSGGGASVDGCWHLNGEYNFLNGNTDSNVSGAGFILNNGNLIALTFQDSSCSYTSGDYTRCGLIAVDVNGFKAPNTYGKDIFKVSLVSNALIPYGARGVTDPDTTCIEGSTATTNSGYGCAAKYLYE